MWGNLQTHTFIVKFILNLKKKKIIKLKISIFEFLNKSSAM